MVALYFDYKICTAGERDSSYTSRYHEHQGWYKVGSSKVQICMVAWVAGEPRRQYQHG